MSTLDQYRTMLPVNKHRLDDELEIQSDIMMRIASSVVTMNGRMIEAKDDLARLEGRLSEDAKEDDPKLSLPAVAAKVLRNPERVRAWQKYQAARTDHELWSHLLEAWQKRGFSMKALSDLYAAQYFSVNSTSLSPRQVARQAEQDEGRAAMRRAGASFRVEEPPTRSEASSSTRRKVVE